MSILKTIGRTLTVGALLLTFFVATSNQADARPNYMSVFKKSYPELAKSKDVKVNCYMCHPKKDNKKKKIRNNYGAALGKVLDKAKETDKEKIAKALKKIEGEKSHVEGKKFGELIKAGKLPGDDKPAKVESEE